MSGAFVFLLLIGAGLLATASIYRPMLAICGFLILTMTNAPSVLVIVHGLPSIGTIMVPALLLLLILRSATGWERPKVALSLVPPLAVYLLFNVIPAPFQEDPALAYGHAEELIKNILIFLILVGFLTTPQRHLLAVRTTALSVGGLAVLSVLQFATQRFESDFLGFSKAILLHLSGEVHGWRMSGPMLDPNFYAQLLVMILPLAIALAFADRPKWRILAAVAAMAMLGAILLTYSRGALLGVAVLSLAYLWLTPRRALILPLLLGLGALAALLAPLGLSERLWSGIDTARLLLGGGDISGDPAVIQRVSVMRAAILMFLDNPFFGVGVAQFPVVYPGYALAHDLDLYAPPAAHSLYLQLAAEQGLTGLLLFAVLIGSAVRMGLWPMRMTNVDGRSRAFSRALLLGLAGFLATSVFLHDAYPRFFWCLLALVVASRNAYADHGPVGTTDKRSSHMSVPSNFAERARAALLQHIPVILIGAMVLGGIAAWTVLRAAPTYRVETTLLYRFGREYFPITPAEVRRNWGENINVTLDNALATELHLLSAYQVAEATVAALPPGEDDRALAVRARALSDNLIVRRVQGATMLSVRIEGTDQESLQPTLDAYIAAYLAHRDTLFHRDAESYFAARSEQLSAQQAELRSQLQAARAQLREVDSRRTVSSWSPDAPIAPVPKTANDTEAEAERLTMKIGDLEARLETLGGQFFEINQAREDWILSRDYTEAVAPNVEIADRSPVTADDTRSAAVVTVISAALLGALLVWMAALVAHLTRAPGRPRASGTVQPGSTTGTAKSTSVPPPAAGENPSSRYRRRKGG